MTLFWNGFGLFGNNRDASSSLGGRLFIDADRDNTENNGTTGGFEPGFDGAVVKLINAQGHVVRTTKTDHNGNYNFSHISAGDYRVEFVLPAGFKFAQKDVGDFRADSDVNAHGLTDTIHVGRGQKVWEVDAGLQDSGGNSSLGGRLFIDADRDNTENNGVTGGFESGFDGAVVKLIDAHGNVIRTTKTDHSGNYNFDHIAAGGYRVEFELPAGFKFAQKDVGDFRADSDVNAHGLTDTIQVGQGQNVWEVDAGLQDSGGNSSLGGRLFIDADRNNTENNANTGGFEAGFDGAVVKLIDAHGNVIRTTKTDHVGNYNFDHIAAGGYRVEFELPAGFKFASKDVGGFRADSDVDASGLTDTIHVGRGQKVWEVDAGLQNTGLPNIVEIAAGSDDFNILVKALDAAGLVDAVRNSTDVTVFAPTDAAFTQLAKDLGFDGDETDEDAVFGFIAGALADLAPDGNPIPLLTDILLYHVSPGAKSASEVDALDQVTTLLTGATFGSEGTELIDNEPDIDNPNIVIPDIAADNGTIQAIDRVLLPIDIPGNGLPNIVEIAAGSDDFNILVKALDAAGLVDAVRNSTDVTVFAPTDAAFTQLAKDLGFDGDETDEDAVFGFIAGALADLAPDGNPIPLLTDILLYHVSPGAKSASEVDALDQVTTLLTGATFGSEGTELIDNEPDIDNPNIVIPDIAADNGTIQAIDRVLLPIDIPGNGLPNIVEIAAGPDDFNILVKALDAAGLVDAVRNSTDVTVFAPTDAAFTQLAKDLGFDGDETDEDAVFGFIAGALADLAPDGNPIPLLTDILLYHVSPGAKSASEVDALDQVTTLLTGATFGSEGTELIDNEPDIDNPNIVIPDIAADNGTIQAIDRVLLPIDIPGNGLPNIVEIAAGSDDFNILVKALDAAGLVDAVRNSTDVTVLAPTDAAFTQLAKDLGFDGDETDEDAVFGFIAGALADLAPDGNPIPLLTDILLYHVSPGAKSASEVDALDQVTTLLTGATFGSEGTELIDNEPDIDNPNIVIPDIAADNGTIQAIDRVLLPIDIPGNGLPNIVEIAAGSDDFNILVKALDAAGLVDAVRNSTDVTVFAPTDAAFTQLAKDLGFDGDETDEDAVFGFIAGALADLAPDGNPIPLLTDILLYHVSPGAKSASEVDALDQVTTLLTGATFGSEGTELIDNEPDIDNPNIVIPDIAADNGTIQAIDRVLLPIDIPGNGLPNIVEIAAGSDDFNILVKALDAAGLVDAVRNSTDVTVFAPTDAAFTQLAKDLGFDGDETDEDAVFGFIAGALADLAPDGNPIPLLTDILLYHVSPGAKSASEVDALDQVTTLLTGATFGSEGTELIDNEPDIDNPNIVIPDIAADNGTIQAIDRVLLPIDIPGNTVGETIIGTFRADSLTGTAGHDLIEGMAGNDRIDGGDGDDVIDGGFGHDFIKGGAGDDHLTGGSGRDTFDFREIEGDDTIKDLSVWDKVLISKDDFANFHELEAAASTVGHDTVITAENGTITLEGIDQHDLNAHQFLFF